MFFRARGDERPQAPLHVDVPFSLQSPVRVLNGVGVDLQFVRKFSDGWQGLIRLENSNGHASPDFIGDLAVDRPRIGGIYVD